MDTLAKQPEQQDWRTAFPPSCQTPKQNPPSAPTPFFCRLPYVTLSAFTLFIIVHDLCLLLFLHLFVYYSHFTCCFYVLFLLLLASFKYMLLEVSRNKDFIVLWQWWFESLNEIKLKYMVHSFEMNASLWHFVFNIIVFRFQSDKMGTNILG